MAAAARSFGAEREAEPAKVARVVGSELVDTYTVCWGRGPPNPGWRLIPGFRVGGIGLEVWTREKWIEGYRFRGGSLG